MTNFFDELKKLADILNLGRMVFYTAAGVLPMIPVFMLIELAGRETSQVKARFSEQLSLDLNSAMSHWPALTAFSIVMGFMIAIVCFVTVIQRENEKAIQLTSDKPLKEYGITYRYPLLKNKKEEDYLNFLISEYYRFAEIAVFIPMGLVLATSFFLPYPVLYLLLAAQQADGTIFNGAHLMLPAAAALSALMWYYVWPRLWVPGVVRPVLESYQYHKRSLICGLTKEKSEANNTTPEIA